MECLEKVVKTDDTIIRYEPEFWRSLAVQGLAEQDTLFCRYCGHKIPADSKFCIKCGKRHGCNGKTVDKNKIHQS